MEELKRLIGIILYISITLFFSYLIGIFLNPFVALLCSFTAGLFLMGLFRDLEKRKPKEKK